MPSNKKTGDTFNDENNNKIIESLNNSLSIRNRQVDLIKKISSEVNSTHNWGEILNIILQSMDQTFDFHHAMIFLMEEDSEDLKLIASQGFDETGIGAKIGLGQGIVGVVGKRKKMMRMGNIGSQKAYLSAIKTKMKEDGSKNNFAEEIEPPGLKNVESKIAIPLLVKDRLVGVFSVESAKNNAFDDLDEILLEIFGNQIAGSIDNAHVYKLAADRLVELNNANEELQKLNENLEDKVTQRTKELSNTLKELSETQDQLILQEKMISLGKMVAGISHEINNPMGALGSAVDVFDRCLVKIKSELDTLDNKKIDKYLNLMNVNLTVLSMSENRINSLVKSLKNFARLDEAEMQKADIHEGIISTLTLLNPEISDKIEIRKEFGSLPLIYCSPSQLNQVFMNLLKNAIQSISGSGSILIKTYLKKENVFVQIIDSGKGISNDKLKNIFEFGFSTGKSRVKMGSGMITTYNIVQKHNGKIKVESKLGSGSTITVILPTNLEKIVNEN